MVTVTVEAVYRPGPAYTIKWNESDSNDFDNLAAMQTWCEQTPPSADDLGLTRWYMVRKWLDLDPDASDSSVIVGAVLRFNLADNTSLFEFTPPPA